MKAALEKKIEKSFDKLTEKGFKRKSQVFPSNSSRKVKNVVELI